MAFSFLDNPVVNTLGLGPVKGKDNHPKSNDFNDIYSNSPNYNFDKNLGFGFRVVTEFGADAPGWKEFILQINPQSMQQDEEFSIQFFPTPKGITIEHQGSIMKDIVISGVTGIHPNRGAGGVNGFNGDLIFGIGDSGYKQFHDLRNYIRAYAEYKKDPANISLRLAFYNFKDQEFYFVEPTKFSLKRDKSRPMLYEYNISMKTIGRTQPIADGNDSFSLFGTIKDVFGGVYNAVKVGRGILNGSIAFLLAVNTNVRSLVLSPLEEVERALIDFHNGYATVISLPRKFLKDLKDQLRAIGDAYANKVGVDTVSYNSFHNKPNTFTTGTITNNPSPTNPYDNFILIPVTTPTYQDQLILNTIAKLENAIELINFRLDHFSETTDKTQKQIDDLYSKLEIKKQLDNTTPLPGANDVGASISNILTPKLSTSTSVKNLQIQDGDTVQKIAARALGDATKFKEIVMLNKLKYPYIASTRGDGVLSYSDTILIPDNKIYDTNIKNIYRNIDYAISASLSEAEKRLGIDIRLTSNHDLAITNTNDYDLIAGVNNMVQAIGIRLGVEKGGYKLHTQFGVSLNIGQKNLFSATLIREEINNQLLQDSRLDKDTKVRVSIAGDVINIDVFARIKTLGQDLPLQLVSS